jgi:hypothetical protein
MKAFALLEEKAKGLPGADQDDITEKITEIGGCV